MKKKNNSKKRIRMLVKELIKDVNKTLWNLDYTLLKILLRNIPKKEKLARARVEKGINKLRQNKNCDMNITGPLCENLKKKEYPLFVRKIARECIKDYLKYALLIDKLLTNLEKDLIELYDEYRKEKKIRI